MTASIESNPTASVLLPVKNGAEEIELTVKHVQNQSFEDIEILIMDDGSTDATWKVINALAQDDSRIRAFKNATNIGIVKSLNHLARDARGKILLREDCGDISHPLRYEKQIHALNASPHATACVTDFWIREADGTAIGIQLVPRSNAAVKESLTKGNIFAHAGFAVRKSAFDEIGGYDERFLCSQDYDLLVRLAAIGPIVSVNQPLLAYKYDPNGITFRNAKKQAAFAQLVRSIHYGHPSPPRVDFPPVSTEEAAYLYHRMIGRLQLIKGRSDRAKMHFRNAQKTRKNMSLSGLLILSYVPGFLLRYMRNVKKGAREELKPFF